MVILKPGPLLGTWYATDKEADGVVRLELSESEDTVVVRAFGDVDAQPYDWGEIHATVYGNGPSAAEAMAFSALYDFGFKTILLAAYAKQGILVLDTFTTFKDGDRTGFFTREFFHR
jgi:hypothetical protein